MTENVMNMEEVKNNTKLDKDTKMFLAKGTVKMAIGMCVNKTIKDAVDIYMPCADNPYKQLAYAIGRVAIVSYVTTKIGGHVDKKIDKTVEVFTEIHSAIKEKRELEKEVAEDASDEAPATAE